MGRLSHQFGVLGTGCANYQSGDGCRAKLICPQFATPLPLPALTLLCRPI